MSMTRVMAGCSCVVLLLVACSSPPTRYYVLESPIAAPQDSAPTTPTCRVSIAAISVPAAVDRPQIVLREGPNRVAILEQERWAEPLRESVPRLLVESLRRHVADGVIVSVRGAAQAQPADVRVSGDFGRFELEERGAALTLHVTVTSSIGPRVVDQSFMVDEASTQGAPAALVAAASRAVDHLGGSLAAVVAAACPRS